MKAPEEKAPEDKIYISQIANYIEEVTGIHQQILVLKSVFTGFRHSDPLCYHYSGGQLFAYDIAFCDARVRMDTVINSHPDSPDSDVYVYDERGERKHCATVFIHGCLWHSLDYLEEYISSDVVLNANLFHVGSLFPACLPDITTVLQCIKSQSRERPVVSVRFFDEDEKPWDESMGG